MADAESSSTSSSGSYTTSEDTNVTKSPASLPHDPSWPPTIDEMAWKPLEQKAMSQEDQSARDLASLDQLAQQIGQTQPQENPEPTMQSQAEPAPQSPLDKNPRSPSTQCDPEFGKQVPKTPWEKTPISPSPKPNPDLGKMTPKTPPKRPSTAPKRQSTPQLMQTAKWIQQPMATARSKPAATPTTVHPFQGFGQAASQYTTVQQTHASPTPIPAQPMPKQVFMTYAAHVAPMQAWPRPAAPSHFAEPATIASTASSSSRPATALHTPKPKSTSEDKATGWKNKLVFFTQCWNQHNWTKTDQAIQNFAADLRRPASGPMWGPRETEASTTRPGKRTWRANADSLVQHYQLRNWKQIDQMVAQWTNDGHFNAMVQKAPESSKPDWWQT